MCSTFEAVPHSPHRFDVTSGLPEFLSQADDVNVHGTVCHRRIVSPDGLDDLVTSENPSGPTCEQVEQVEFGVCERNMNAANGYLVAPG